MSVLVVAEHDNKNLNSSTYNTLAAAFELNSDVVLLIAGNDCASVSEQACAIVGVTKVMVAAASSYQHFLAENLAPLIAQLATDHTHVLAPASTFGKNILPRVAALLDVAQISDIVQIQSPDTFARPIYAGNAIATVTSYDAIKVISTRSSAFDYVERSGVANASVETLDIVIDKQQSKFVDTQLTVSERPDLLSAKVVIAGGRGLKSTENFQLLEKLATTLHAAIGASRAAVDAGFVPNDLQVGQTGKVVAPDLYIAVGISGAIQHLAGMKDSKVIVAINKDPDAPIFQVADYGLVADLFEAIPELTSSLQE